MPLLEMPHYGVEDEFDTNRDPRAALGIVEGVLAPTALLPRQEDVGPAGATRVVELASPANHRHQERMPRRLEVADHAHAEEPAVEQQKAGPDPDAGCLVQEALEHGLHRFAAADRRQGHGVAMVLVDHIGRGIGMEMRGAALGFAADDFLGIARGRAVIGDQGQVDGHPLTALPQRLGQVSGQGTVELPLGLGEVGQGGQQGQPRRLVGRGIAEAFAGIGQRGDPRGGVEQERQEQSGAALGSVIVELQVGLQQRRGVLMDLVGGERILRWAHGFLLK